MLAAAVSALVASKRKWYDIVFSFVLLGGGTLALILPVLLNNVLWMPPRTIVPMFCIFVYLGCIAMLGSSKKTKQILCLLLLLALTRQIFFIRDYSDDVLTSNSYDKQWVDYVQTEITEYETQNNVSVTKLGVYTDPAISYFWDGIQYSWDVCNRAPAISYARKDIFLYYYGRKYESVSVPDAIQYQLQEAAQKDLFLGTDLYIENDTCYVYIK